MPNTHGAATELASLPDGSTAGELIPELARHGLLQLIEMEVASVIGAERHERSEERLGHRNGYRPRSLATQVGDIDLLIPKLRSGGFLPSILEPRRRVGQALYEVIMEAYIGGVSTRKVDALVAVAPPGVWLRLRLPLCDVPAWAAGQGPAGVLQSRGRGHECQRQRPL